MNLLQTNLFRLHIEGMDNLVLSLISNSIPTLTMQSINTRFRKFPGVVPGEGITYDPYQCRFVVDESFKAYKELMNWMLSNRDSNKQTPHDMVLTMYSSTNNPVAQIRFVNAFPISLGSIEFDIQKTNTEYAASDVTFSYDYFEFV